ncbi:MAG TPA: response regulator [Bryobacteraceae bacterium]|jgi:CheY-like chemotaxis protein|nr:response regulator [Bryobacteraceae bacterium]
MTARKPSVERQPPAKRCIISEVVDFQILLVDDNPADAHIFEVALKDASTRVMLYWVASAREALDFLHQRGRFLDIGPTRIVVLDLNLPRIDGFGVLEQIKANPATRQTPVIIFTSSTAPEDVNKAYALGANAYFTKPMTLDSYVNKLRILVQHWLDLAELPSSSFVTSTPYQQAADRSFFERDR